MGQGGGEASRETGGKEDGWQGKREARSMDGVE